MSPIIGLQPFRSPRLSLLLYFTLWKVIFFVIAYLSPGPGYDTSTTLLQPALSSSVRPFVRWDAIYFTQTAQRGYLFEQEWAFSWTYTRFLAFMATYLRLLGLPPVDAESWAGIITANLSHFIAVLLLYELSLTLFKLRSHVESLSFVAACTHIISPAGMFLSAPYAESSFSMLQFLAYLLYAQSWIAGRGGRSTARDALLLLSGAVLGLATALRSNGLFSGLLFAHDALLTGIELLRAPTSLSILRKLIVIGLSGVLVGLGAIVPQIVAYQDYCTNPGTDLRPWCNAMPPSIYTFVQSHYWNVGFLKYWTLSNAPLFLLAAPMLLVLTVSSLWAFNSETPSTKDTKSKAVLIQVNSPESLLPLLGSSQLLLVVITLTTSHVQIASRLSSGYPIWYLWLACSIVERHAVGVSNTFKLIQPRIVVSWMVMYAIIQGGLFASFLPPA